MIAYKLIKIYQMNIHIKWNWTLGSYGVSYVFWSSLTQASFGKGSISLIILFKEKTWLFQKGENDILCLIAAILGNTYGCLNTSIFTYTLARKSLLINRLYPLAFSLLERNLKKYYYHSYRNWQDWNWRDRPSETNFLRLNICVPLTFKKFFKILKCQLYFK